MSSPSFACPGCDGPTEVKDSRPRPEGSGIRRRRLCGQCGQRFTTWEVQAGDIDALVSGIQNATPAVYEMAKSLISVFAAMHADDRLVILSLARRLSGGSASHKLYRIARGVDALPADAEDAAA